MTARAYCRGHAIEYNGKEWIYSDTKKAVDETRPCARCGRALMLEGYDACLGHIPDASSACCGHGVTSKHIKYNLFHMKH